MCSSDLAGSAAAAARRSNAFWRTRPINRRRSGSGPISTPTDASGPVLPLHFRGAIPRPQRLESRAHKSTSEPTPTTYAGPRPQFNQHTHRAPSPSPPLRMERDGVRQGQVITLSSDSTPPHPCPLPENRGEGARRWPIEFQGAIPRPQRLESRAHKSTSEPTPTTHAGPRPQFNQRTHRAPSPSPPAGMERDGVRQGQVITHSSNSTPDRKSTRLNSSH